MPVVNPLPSGGGGHDAVTLNASVADVLGLSTQELTADDLGADKRWGWDESAGKAIGFAAGTVIAPETTSVYSDAGIAPGGRLTLESGVPVSTADQTAKTALYYTPFIHDRVRVLSAGSVIREFQFTEITLNAPALTNALPYDVFLYDNAGTLTMEALVWTNTTTRATALAWQAGLGYVKSGATTRFYLGTIFASDTNKMEDSAAKRFVWNAYNRVRRPVSVHDSTDSWTYTTATWRQKRATTTNQFACVCGLAGTSVASLVEMASPAPSTTAVLLRCGIGYDATNARATGERNASTYNTPAGVVIPIQAHLDHCPGIGYHYYAELEYSTASGTSTWYGDAGAASDLQTGMSGTYDA